LFNILCFQEFNVQELMGILRMGQSRISRHLKILQDAGLIASRRDGLWAFYRATDNDPGRRFTEAIRYLLEEQSLFEQDLETAAELLRSRKLQTRRFFDSVASSWEIMKRSIIGELDLVAEIRKRIPRANSVADLGCGSGALLERLMGNVETLIGVDSSREMLAEAAKRLNRETVDLRIGEVEHLPLRDRETEVAVINLVLHHLRNPREGLQEVHRVLSPGGTLIVADFCKHEQETMRSRFGDHWLGFSIEEFETWLKEAGMRIEERELYPVHNNIKVFLYRGSKQGI
jgi:ArsR family transcriptional regulator